MKKIFLYLMFLLGAQICVFSQEQHHLFLQFAGRTLTPQSYFGLSSVRINNLTKNCDTTISSGLEFLDLIISGMNGIDEMDKNRADFILKQNYPNPFTESTNVNIYRAYSGPLTLVLSDELGRKLTEYHSESDKGNHQFQISSPGNKILILTVSDDKNIRSIKLISAGQGHASYKIKYIGQAPNNEKRTLKSQETKQFVFDLGDQLEFTAYSFGYLSKTIVDSPLADSTYIFDLSRCTIPAVTTFPATNITQTTTTCGGNIDSGNDSTVTARGVIVILNTFLNPNIPILYPADDAGPGNFIIELSNLPPGSAFTIQAYATTGLGTSLGNELRFTTLTDNPVYSDMADAEEAVKKAYYTTIGRYREASMFSDEYYYVFNLIAGETQYLHPETRYTDLGNFKFGLNNELIGELYNELYIMIVKANDAQNRLVNMINSGHWSGADLQRLKNMQGEVLFLRGMAYSFLIRSFGEKLPTNPGYSPASMGVPILDTLTGVYAERKRNTCGEIYTHIIRDFSMAETLLPDSWSETEKGKATKASARGFLGEIYIYLADWTNASSVFERVINDGQHSLVDNFQENFDRFHFHNKESIFEAECDNSVIGVFHGAYSYRLYAKQSWGTQKVPTATIDKFGETVILNNTALAAGLASKNIAIGGLQKSYIDSLYNVSVPLIGMVFENKAAYLAYIDPLTSIPFYKSDGITFQQAVRIWLDALISKDPRLYPTVYIPKVDSLYVFNSTCEKTLSVYYYSDYGQKKYIPNDIEVENALSCGFGDNGFMTMNFRILRLDDIYLYYAESEFNKGNIVTAFEYLNKVVRRAYGKNGASSSEYDYPVSADFMTVLKKERFKEFCLEGKTMFDVRRWNDALKEWGARGYTEGKNNALPIPESEIYLNPGISQNPGY
jgi:hypothetical protein